MQKQILLFGLFIFLPFSFFAQVELSELGHTNMNFIADEDGEYSDWLEKARICKKVIGGAQQLYISV